MAILTDPWPHKTVANFLSKERFEAIKILAAHEQEYLDMFGFYTRSGHYIRYEPIDILPEITFDMFSDMPMRSHSGNLKKIIHWSIHPKGFSYPAHIDNESRISTAVLYITPKRNKGTILCKNNSPHNPDHGRPSQESEYEVETEWKPNNLFLHNSINGTTWHRYEASTQRTTLNVFFVEPDKIMPDRIENRFLL
mgnify:FL=1